MLHRDDVRRHLGHELRAACPSSSWTYGYPVAIGLIATACGLLYWRFPHRRAGSSRWTPTPDPNQILSRLKQEEAEAKRGKLKIFFGASAGVGKTFAMLAAARATRAGHRRRHRRRDRDPRPCRDAGADRRFRSAAAEGSGPPRAGAARVRSRRRDGARAALVLVDELAHSNVAGSQHAKRWQDVEELLDAGIDVWSTVNVQHLETLNDIVSGVRPGCASGRRCPTAYSTRPTRS